MPADSLASLAQRLLRGRIEHRMQKLVELLRIDAQHRFLLSINPLAHHIHRNADGAGPVRLPLRV